MSTLENTISERPIPIPNIPPENYVTLRENLSNRALINAVCRIQNSNRFEIGERSHILLKGTGVFVGYIGNDSLELCASPGTPVKSYKSQYKHLKRIFMAC